MQESETTKHHKGQKTQYHITSLAIDAQSFIVWWPSDGSVLLHMHSFFQSRAAAVHVSVKLAHSMIFHTFHHLRLDVPCASVSLFAYFWSVRKSQAKASIERKSNQHPIRKNTDSSCMGRARKTHV